MDKANFTKITSNHDITDGDGKVYLTLNGQVHWFGHSEHTSRNGLQESIEAIDWLRLITMWWLDCLHVHVIKSYQ